MMEPSEFRRILGHFASGVTILTTRTPAGRPCGLTLSAFTSVSLEPPLVLACVERDADTHGCLSASGYFAVNILPEERGETLARRFATFGVDAKFDGLAYREEHTGAPILEAALAWVDCRVHEELPGGDHTIFLGEVLAGDTGEGAPLVYYRGGYGRYQP